MDHQWSIHRRRLLQMLAAGTALSALPLPLSLAQGRQPLALERTIPSSGEAVPSVGLGTWITFNVGDNQRLLDSCADVMAAFFDGGGAMIDSSPMYGSSQNTVGYGLDRLNARDEVFSADKIWTRDGDEGRPQSRESADLWRIEGFDLLQVHNLVSWQAHMKTLRAMKEEGTVRYIGITTSHGRRHDEMERIMRSEPIDFIQLTYNPVDREAEDRLLPLAREKGIGVIVNRPFRRGALTESLAGDPLPEWAGEVDASSWAQLILKFILSNPAVTCAIPATTRVDHVRENLAAATGPLPDHDFRERISDTIRSLY
ncbi:Aldo/keto reductase [Marinobacter daqiaonensis]|uniref:Aldo/keto reductase n=1 Tax=Marinobacter daqiaonensis TaxID=650891 RepID=A0A1I6JP03_9GAMM|nr:aldo/keto reductase [Marinobacter daqiaonensis]SFR80699.1 Aldo/keto reductase [Marinobacter daqiaonensis]